MSVWEAAEYSVSLRNTHLELRELVDANLVESAGQQQQSNHGSEPGKKIRVGQQVLLNNFNEGKARPPTDWTLEGYCFRGAIHNCAEDGFLGLGEVHVNCVGPLLTEEAADRCCTDWSPHLFRHEEGVVVSPLAEDQQSVHSHDMAGTRSLLLDVMANSATSRHTPSPGTSPSCQKPHTVGG